MTDVRSTEQRSVEQWLASRGLRFTTGRKLVVDELQRAGGPRSAAELHGDLGGMVPVSSVYRTLAVLEGAGVVEPHHSTKGVTRYEIAEWLAGHHHHLICLECGVVDDFELPGGLEGELERLVGRVSDLSQFTATGHSLEVAGRCSKCR
jgi:Fe2+ or Zn2+ uptake regulation protein